MTVEDVKVASHKVDLALHPYIVICSPAVYKMFMETESEYFKENEDYFFENSSLPDDKFYVLDRAFLDICTKEDYFGEE